jgi:hypothetical protein
MITQYCVGDSSRHGRHGCGKLCWRWNNLCGHNERRKLNSLYGHSTLDSFLRFKVAASFAVDSWKAVSYLDNLSLVSFNYCLRHLTIHRTICCTNKSSAVGGYSYYNGRFSAPECEIETFHSKLNPCISGFG